VTSLDQDTSAEAETPSESGVVAALRRSLEASGVKVDAPPAADSAALSYKERLIKQLSVTFERDQQRTGKDEAWNGSTFQVMSWHYGKSLGRYFNNPAEIEPMVKTVKMATHVVFGGLIAAMLLLLVASRKTGSLFYWLLILVPIALPVFFIIDYTAWLWFFGHNLNAMGAFTVKPFMPTVFGQGKVAQFATHSYPSSGFGLMLLMSLVLGIAALTRRKQLRDAGT
jgi:ABC-type sugar transport system permease subunit